MDLDITELVILKKKEVLPYLSWVSRAGAQRSAEGLAERGQRFRGQRFRGIAGRGQRFRGIDNTKGV